MWRAPSCSCSVLDTPLQINAKWPQSKDNRALQCFNGHIDSIDTGIGAL